MLRRIMWRGDVDKDDNVAEDGVDDHDVVEDEVEDEGEDEDVKGEEDDVDVEEEEDDDVEEDYVEEEDRSQDPEAHFVRAYAGDMRMDISQEPVCMEIYRKNGRGHFRGHRFVRASAVEMHMDMSQGAFRAEIYRENTDASDTTSIEHRPLTVTVRAPQCGRTVWGKKENPKARWFLVDVYPYGSSSTSLDT